MHQSLDAPAAAGDAAAAGVEHDGALPGGGERLRQIVLRLVNHEARGAGAGLLVAVGVADQHALAPPARIQMPPIQRIREQLLQRAAAGGERLRGLELRREVERHFPGALVVRRGPARQQQRRQHIVRAAGAAHDEVADGVGAIAVAALHDGIEHREVALAERIEVRDGSAILLQRLGEPVAALAAAAAGPQRVVEAARHDLVQNTGMLAHVERREVKSEGVDPAQQALDVEQAGVRALVGSEARGDQRHVVAELPRTLVTARPAFVGAAQALAELREEHAVRHAVMPRRGDGARPGQQPRVLLDPLGQLAGRRHAAGALRQALRDALALLEIAVDDHLLLARQRLADALGVHVGVAVHVAARPGSDVQDGRHPRRAGVGAVELLQRLRDFLVERRHHAVQDLHQVEQDLLALIRDREPFARQLLGLPRRGQLHTDAAPDTAGFVRREGRVETFDQALCDAQLLAQQRPAAGFGRMRREHRLDGQTADELEDLRRGEALALQRGDRILHAAGLGPLTVLEQILAAAPDAVDPFRQIDALEPGGEGAHHFARQRRRALAYTSRELGVRFARAGAAADGGDAVQLHQLEQLLPALLAQDFAHERAERMHVLAQRLVLGRKVDVAAVHLQSFQVLALASKCVS